jgi:ABC-type transporter Mla subunit MlaD
MERAVGWFVLLATAVLVFGFVYYVYHTAQRKGWFVTKAPYFTFADRATGLKIGDPVKLMGFDVGQITRIDAMPPYEPYNVYVEFQIKSPYYGYIWTKGSRAKVNTADFLGKRVLEVTKGTDGYPSYAFNPLKEITLSEAEGLKDLQKWQLAEEIFDASGTNRVFKALTPLFKTNLATLTTLGIQKIRVLDTREEKKSMTAVWNDHEGVYEPYAKTNLYWLLSDEWPAVSERLEKLVGQVEKALPNFLSLTNQLAGVLSNSFNFTSNLNALASEARPAASNLTALSAQLRGPGALGEWMLGTNIQQQVSATLESANTAVTRADTNLTALVENLGHSLDHLADITSNLNAQVQANTNILSDISAAIVHTDELVQGLKRHWLLRSAFRSKTNATTTNLPTQWLLSPKEKGQR